MSDPKLPSRAIPLYILFAASFAAVAAVLFFGPTRAFRLGVGTVLLLPIGWAAAQLGAIEDVLKQLKARRYRRKFHKLRLVVDELLKEVRQLNGLAIKGHEQGTTSETHIEIAAIEGRMHDLVEHIREEATSALAVAPTTNH